MDMDLVKKTPAEKEEAFRLLQKLYASEPIKPRKPPAPLPETLQQLRAMEKDGESQYETTPELFVRQGMAAAAYEDDTVYDLPVLHYYPTYRELVRNMATRTRPEGGALPLILDRWINQVQQQVVAESGLSLTDGRLDGRVEQKIGQVIDALNEMVHGFDFARLLTLYYRSYRQGDEATKAKVIQWFRGEFHTKTEARQELGVNIIISDEDWYEYLKIFALFLKQAGYAGLLVCIDELVNIYKIPHAITRQYNYEKILTMYNDTLQGKAHYLGIIMGGTPQCMEDPRRGVYSYEALRSRLAEGHFAGEHKDLLAPVIRLQPLTSDEMLVLVEKLAEIHGALYGYAPKVIQEDLVTFIRIEFQRIGADSHITPREVIRDFIEVLDILYQHPELKVAELLQSDSFQYAKNAVEGEETAPEFAEFTI